MERSFLRQLADIAPTDSRTRIGIGDDAAVLAWRHDADCVVTTDLIAEGSHFQSGANTRYEDIGRKALAVNLSDLAAMGAVPRAATVGLLLNAKDAASAAQGITLGVQRLAAKYELELIGGDTNTWSGGIVVCVTALGEVGGGEAWTRSGAKPGDYIVVTGELGGSILGKHLEFTPRVEEARRIREQVAVHAAMDISDGLSLDLFRMAIASGTGALIDLEQIPVADAARELAARDGRSATEHALQDGEDFELLLALPEESLASVKAMRLPTPLSVVGRMIEDPGLWQRTEHGKRELTPSGYEH